MSYFKIEKGIPAPRRNARYPLRKMVTGDSFFVPCADEEKAKTQKRLGVAGYSIGGAGAFVVRQVEGGVRVWKIKEENDGGE